MNPYNPYTQHLAGAPASVDSSAFFRKVYAYMAGGLFATGVTATAVASSESLAKMIWGNQIVFFGLIIAEVIMVLSFSKVVSRLSTTGAAAFFLAYAVLNGLTLSIIFLAYTASSIASTFFVTAGTFGALSAYGYVTKRDLTGVGNFAMMGLIGLIIASIVNIFLNSPMMYWLTTFVGVIVFTALTAYDTQKLKQFAASSSSPDQQSKVALQGALMLYLDFINLFLYLLRVLGRRR
ncbi:MAG TPA: Bax inhibitor-1/YccA family protein [Polyangiaceae bacterium]|jgi:FtsH-binding integral membrane protein|nr:Bax inhibitor-1/YccA family protein [Polyangiaceae bacterium]